MPCFVYYEIMFVSVVTDPDSNDTAGELAKLLTRFGFQKVQRACWESTKIDDSHLAELKREIDRVTNYYDIVRLYQFPVEGMFAVTELKQKKWKRGLFKG